MTWTWAVNPMNNDLFINKAGRLQTVAGAQEVKQRILIALQHFWEEYFLNVPDGVPWDELILGSKDIKLTEGVLRQAILSVPGVAAILSFEMRFSDDGRRQLKITTKVQVTGTFGSDVIDVFFSQRG